MWGGLHRGCGGCRVVVMNVLRLKRILCHFPGEREIKVVEGRGRRGRRCCEIGCVVLMEQSSSQLGKLSSHPNMCTFVYVCMLVECRKKARKKAYECPTAYKHTTHTHYPHVLGPYICICFILYLLYLFPLTHCFSTCIHALAHTRTCAMKTRFKGTMSVITSHRFLTGVHCYFLQALIK